MLNFYFFTYCSFDIDKRFLNLKYDNCYFRFLSEYYTDEDFYEKLTDLIKKELSNNKNDHNIIYFMNDKLTNAYSDLENDKNIYFYIKNPVFHNGMLDVLNDKTTTPVITRYIRNMVNDKDCLNFISNLFCFASNYQFSEPVEELIVYFVNNKFFQTAFFLLKTREVDYKVRVTEHNLSVEDVLIYHNLSEKQLQDKESFIDTQKDFEIKKDFSQPALTKKNGGHK